MSYLTDIEYNKLIKRADRISKLIALVIEDPNWLKYLGNVHSALVDSRDSVYTDITELVNKDEESEL